MADRAIRGALFDLDGLAVDSEPLHVEAWRRAMVDAGAGWDPAWIDPYFGTPVDTTVLGLSRDHGVHPYSKWRKRPIAFQDRT